MRKHATTQEVHDEIVEAMKVEGNCVKTFERDFNEWTVD